VRRPISPRIRIAWLAPVRGKPRHDQEPRAEKYRAVQIHQREWVSLVEAVFRPQRGRQGHRPSPSHLNGHRSPCRESVYQDLDWLPAVLTFPPAPAPEDAVARSSKRPGERSRHHLYPSPLYA
jgi:hypothetical protein